MFGFGYGLVFALGLLLSLSPQLLLLLLLLFTSQLIIVFFDLRGEFAADVAAVRARVAAAVLFPLRSRRAAMADASKTGDIAMTLALALAHSDLGLKAITFSASEEGDDVAPEATREKTSES